MRALWVVLMGGLSLGGLSFAGEVVHKASDDAALRAALRRAGPGTRIAIAPGRYQPGVFASNLRGTAEKPIVVEGADPKDPPLFEPQAPGAARFGAAALQLPHQPGVRREIGPRPLVAALHTEQSSGVGARPVQ